MTSVSSNYLPGLPQTVFFHPYHETGFGWREYSTNKSEIILYSSVPLVRVQI